VSDKPVSLPIFPLALVLVPGELLPLHVFEERYKAMMAAVLEGEKCFGLSYADRAEVGKTVVAPVGSVGCIARITAVVPLKEGRMNVLTVGAGRYVIRSYVQHEPYLIAEVDSLCDEQTDDFQVNEMADGLRLLFQRLSAAARTLSGGSDEGASPELDVGPEALSFLIAANIALDASFKQELLEGTNTLARLRALDERLRVMVDTYEYRVSMHRRSKGNGHGTLRE
jgi:Lon protease-like protein